MAHLLEEKNLNDIVKQMEQEIKNEEKDSMMQSSVVFQ
jgi:hypothetical protein